VSVVTIIFLFGIILFNSINKISKNNNKSSLNLNLKPEKRINNSQIKSKITSVRLSKKGGEKVWKSF